MRPSRKEKRPDETFEKPNFVSDGCVLCLGALQLLDPLTRLRRTVRLNIYLLLHILETVALFVQRIALILGHAVHRYLIYEHIF